MYLANELARVGQKECPMSNLLTAVLNAHGGLDHWREFSQV